LGEEEEEDDEELLVPLELLGHFAWAFFMTRIWS
jgi:hypothetical protein